MMVAKSQSHESLADMRSLPWLVRLKIFALVTVTNLAQPWDGSVTRSVLSFFDWPMPRPGTSSRPSLPWLVPLKIFALVTVANLVRRRDGSVKRFLLSLLDWKTPPMPRPDMSSRPSLPWLVRLKIFALATLANLVHRRDGSVNRPLLSLFDWKTPSMPRPDALGVRSTDVTVDSSRDLWARVYYPPADSSGPTPLPVVVYIHGGGFMIFSTSYWAQDQVCRRFCLGLGVVLVSVNYRLAPEHRYPAAYDDCMDVLRYLGSTGLPADISVRIDLSRCFLIGDSAGGNIAHHVAREWTISSASPSSDNTVHLAGIILLQPFFGGEERTEAELRMDGVAPIVNMCLSDWAWRSFLPEGADRNHPAAHVTGEAGPEPELGEAFPPTMVVVGGHDPLQDWQRRYAAMMLRKGKAARLVEFPSAIHAFYVFPELPDGVRLVEEMKEFIANTPSNDQDPARKVAY